MDINHEVGFEVWKVSVSLSVSSQKKVGTKKFLKSFYRYYGANIVEVI